MMIVNKIKNFVVLHGLVLCGLVAAEELALAEECHAENCVPPNCRCASQDIPGGLSPKETPQFVTITFDDGVNILNIETYRSILYNRQNSNGCPAGATFYVNHEYTNYQLVHELYSQGFEIALHSITHQTPQTNWRAASYEMMKREFADQMKQMSHFANIPKNEIKGVRLPFLQMAGNNSFHVMKDFGLQYDCTWITGYYNKGGLWPYTLDYASSQDCLVHPCPTASIPGVWVQPMVSWIDLNGRICSMVDSCAYVPDRSDADAWYDFIVQNFERHYLNNRAPFGFYIHEWYLTTYPAVKAALVRFLNMINKLRGVYMVNSHQVIDWIKNPVSIYEYKQQACRRHTPTSCIPRSCGPIAAEHNNMDYWMQICSACPRVYPWIGNPLGE